MESTAAGRVLLAVGILVAVLGLVLALGGRLPFGSLPGDVSGGSGGVSWSIPIGSSLLISVVLTILLNIALR